MKKVDPPALLEQFFRWFCKDSHLEGLEGDLYELFDRRVERNGAFAAQCLYLFDMLSLLRSSVARPIKKNSRLNTMGIFKNYFKTAIRLAWKQKSFSAINLIGLTAGITCAIFVSLYVNDELRYDDHLTQSHLKFRFYNEVTKEKGISSSYPIVPPMYALSAREDFPQFAKVGRVFLDYGGTIFNLDERVFSEKNGVYAEREALDILNVELVAGNLDDLGAPRKMLLSESTFKKFFGDIPWEGQTVQLTRSTVDVVGVYKDFPTRSHIRPDYIFSFDWLLESVSESRMKSWRWQQFYTYFQVAPETDIQLLQEQFQEYIIGIAHPITQEVGLTYMPFFQQVTDIHLHSSDFQWEIAEVGNYQSILFLGIAAAIILVIACLNFINLTTAQSINRGREVGIRKFVGATRMQLLTQTVMESILYCFIAGLMATALVVGGLDVFNEFADKSFGLKEVFTVEHLSIFVGSLMVLGAFSGWYPALVIARFQPIAVLHGGRTIRVVVGARTYQWSAQQILVAAQYVLSVSLILISLIFSDQYRYLVNKDMGFQKENLLTMQLTSSLRQDLEASRAAFSGHTGIDNISFCYGIPGDLVAGDGAFFPELLKREFSSSLFLVDHQYIDVMGMDMVAGRSFSQDMVTDASQAYIINETAVRNLGLGSPEEALGQSVKWKMWTAADTFKVGKVIGVVQDFNFKSLHHEVENVIMHIEPRYLTYMIVRLNGNQLRDAMDHLENAYRSFEPTRPFEYQFVDQSFARFYSSELKMERLFTLFALLAILTAAIGLYGLVSYSVANRSKEISIRKVLGA
ncbi:MAG: ABC transporter permease, partial [Bacteroidota bacterium]